MKYLIILLLMASCSPKYEVVQEVYPGMYHTQGLRNKDVILYKTEMRLNPGDIVIIPNKIKRKNNGN